MNAASASVKNAALQAAAQSITAWYQGNIGAIDSVAGAVNAPTVSAQWGMTVLESSRLNCNGATQAHRYAVVIPSSEGMATTLDPVTGVLKVGPNDLAQMVDGCQIGVALVTESKAKAAGLASALESYSAAMSTQGFGGNGENFFTGAACGGWGSVGCSAYTSSPPYYSSAQMLEPALGVSDFDCKDAYGNFMVLDNTSSSVITQASPFTARIGFMPPWGVSANDIIWTIAISQS